MKARTPLFSANLTTYMCQNTGTVSKFGIFVGCWQLDMWRMRDFTTKKCHVIGVIPTTQIYPMCVTTPPQLSIPPKI